MNVTYDSSHTAGAAAPICIDTDDVDMDQLFGDEKFRSDLKKWSLDHNISHAALKQLFRLINERLKKPTKSPFDESFLPMDPRTLLQTPRSISIVPLTDGEYWHYGVEKWIRRIMPKLNAPKTISLMINIDGLPLFNSSKVEFWPIIFNIHGLPQISPMPIGIFCGKSKSADIDSFLSPFVDEMKVIMSDGIIINSHKITVNLRCFVCDSPARAFVKGKRISYTYK